MSGGDEFERRLNRLFAEAPALPDADLFAAEVQTRLDRGQAVRRAVIGAVGGIGAVFAAAQLVSTGWLAQVSRGLAREGGPELQMSGLLANAEGLLAPGGVVGPEALWTVAALAVMALAFAATRWADQV